VDVPDDQRVGKRGEGKKARSQSLKRKRKPTVYPREKKKPKMFGPEKKFIRSQVHPQPTFAVVISYKEGKGWGVLEATKKGGEKNEQNCKIH